jgi:phosphatidylserine/phosphatidylglycerophosphate/cardiolipin synthase-like enzyme
MKNTLIATIFTCFFAHALCAQQSYLVQSRITPQGFVLQWPSAQGATQGVLIGTSGERLQWRAANEVSNSECTVEFNDLQPGTIYWAKQAVINGADTMSLGNAVPFATQSLSSGEILVYFNHSIDNQYIGNKQPSGISGNECLAAIIQRIDNAQQTLDVALYNTNRTDLVTAVRNAHNRGVRVRYIAAAATQNSALSPAPPFPVVYGNNDYLMHNKFMVIDANLAQSAWVMGGSMNWTTSNTIYDYNNMVLVQDQSLAKAYELEFNEMWGGSDAQPNAANQKFGEAKTDNTPHQFVIGGISVECYFSPSDNVTNRIVNTLKTANSSVDFGLLTFTKDEPSDVLVEKHNLNDVLVRGLIENVDDTGSEYNYLKNNGIEVAEHTYPDQMHHKYAVIDAELPASDPTVWTGSHNWTFTAENFNDENSLVFHDLDIAKLFHAEFEARLAENPVPVLEPSQEPAFRLMPNPAYTAFALLSSQYDLGTDARIRVVAANGAVVLDQPYVAGQQVQIAHLPDGHYVVKITAHNAYATLPLQKVSR